MSVNDSKGSVNTTTYFNTNSKLDLYTVVDNGNAFNINILAKKELIKLENSQQKNYDVLQYIFSLIIDKI